MGKPQIYFANMGHGEAIAFELNGQWYLRDFGESSSLRKESTQCNIGKILNSKVCHNCEIKGFIRPEKKWDVIVSHFHDDHVRGFERLFDIENSSKIFGNAFLPAQYLSNNKSDKKCFLLYMEANLHIFCFAKQRGYRNNARSFFTIPVIMNALADRVQYLSSNNRNNAFPGTIYCPTDTLALDDLANGYDIEKSLEDYYGSNSYNSNSVDDFRRTANELYCIMEKYILNDAGTDVGSTKKDYKIIVDKIKKLSERHKKSSRDVRTLQNAVKGSIDDRSLVFDTVFPSDTKIDVLFLGDNNDTSLRRLVGSFKEHYDYIKADHHGSRGGKVLKKFFDSRSPESKVTTTVCCCGKGHRSGEVNSEYYDMSKNVLLTEKKDSWKQSFHREIKQCRIMPDNL